MSRGRLFKTNGIGLAEKTIINFITKALRLYEQEPPHTRARRLEEYTIRWTTWALAGLLNILINIEFLMKRWDGTTTIDITETRNTIWYTGLIFKKRDASH